jgi:hypothetical protein
MEQRLDLFEHYCLPTVMAQSNANFTWMLYFDRNTPERHLQRVRQGLGGAPHCVIKLCDVYGSETVQADLSADLDKSRKWLVTSRLDNDDGLHRDFIRLVQQQVRVGTVEALDFPVGIVLASDMPFVSKQGSNAFISLSEPLDGMQTVLIMRHKEMGRRYKIRTIKSGPAWLQTVHGANVSNKVRGWRISRDELPDDFAIKGGLPPERDSRLAITFDNATLGTARYARDVAAAAWNLIRRPPWVTAP